MGGSAAERLAAAIGYPDAPAGGGSGPSIFRVDGAEVLCEETDGRIVLSCRLGGDESRLGALAAFAPGRMLKEDAILAWDGGAVLWQDAPAAADRHALLRLFETFMDSCDWWRERAGSAGAAAESESHGPETFVIMP